MQSQVLRSARPSGLSTAPPHRALPILLRRCNKASAPYVPRATDDQVANEDHGAVAKLIADTMIANDQVIGLGTGLAVNELIKEISERLTDGRLQGVKFISASDVSASEAAFYGVPMTTLNEAGGSIPLMVDAANELDIENLAYITGRGENGPQTGQPSLPRLRELLNVAEQVVAIVDEKDLCGRLGGNLPVLIEGDPETWEETAEELDDIFLGDAEIRRRSFSVEAGPRGGDNPVITPDGHMILDIQFYDGLKLFGEEEIYERVAYEIESVSGVVAHGLVVNYAQKAVIVGSGGEGGSQPRVLVREEEEETAA